MAMPMGPEPVLMTVELSDGSRWGGEVTRVEWDQYQFWGRGSLTGRVEPRCPIRGGDKCKVTVGGVQVEGYCPERLTYQRAADEPPPEIIASWPAPLVGLLPGGGAVTERDVTPLKGTALVFWADRLGGFEYTGVGLSAKEDAAKVTLAVSTPPGVFARADLSADELETLAAMCRNAAAWLRKKATPPPAAPAVAGR